ncbi:uncharacterized protein LOC113232793 [Hyposmocoma kahamanoa]|uniref:uncharacterized protein LOC113232793 n=1 Tax=Hyposmocoma kahamanoa TaxID=1477025 RepID=UPI000E6D8872|nr:uncharacterized protein LOC113232793 [Hyposmocoma kahamanoa]
MPQVKRHFEQYSDGWLPHLTNLVSDNLLQSLASAMRHHRPADLMHKLHRPRASDSRHPHHGNDNLLLPLERSNPWKGNIISNAQYRKVRISKDYLMNIGCFEKSGLSRKFRQCN